jgi:hypothetical protein
MWPMRYSRLQSDGGICARMGSCFLGSDLLGGAIGSDRRGFGRSVGLKIAIEVRAAQFTGLSAIFPVF